MSSTPEPIRTTGPMPGGKLQVCVCVCVCTYASFLSLWVMIDISATFLERKQASYGVITVLLIDVAECNGHFMKIGKQFSSKGLSLQINEDSTEIQNALAFAVEELNTRHDQPKRAMISDVISAHSQVKFLISVFTFKC